MTTTADFRALLDQFDAKMAETGAAEARLKMFEGTLNEIAAAMTAIVAVMEKPEEPETPDDYSAIVAAIQGIQLKAPDVTVTVPPAAAPVVQVMPAARTAWDFAFEYSTATGALTKMRALPVDAV